MLAALVGIGGADELAAMPLPATEAPLPGSKTMLFQLPGVFATLVNTTGSSALPSARRVASRPADTHGVPDRSDRAARSRPAARHE